MKFNKLYQILDPKAFIRTFEKHQKQPKMTKKHQNHQNHEKHEKRPKMTKKHQKWPKIAKNTKNAFVSKMGGPKMAPRGPEKKSVTK